MKGSVQLPFIQRLDKMACSFQNVFNSCGCTVGYNLPLLTPEDVEIDAYPVNVLNVNEEDLGIANTPSEYAFIWNSDPDNKAFGTLFVGVGTYCFYLKKKTGVVPPSKVMGGEGNPPVPLSFKFGFTGLDTTGDVPTELAYIESVDEVFDATEEQTGMFNSNGPVSVDDFDNTEDKVLFIQVPASEEAFTFWSEVGNPLQQLKPINQTYGTDEGLFFKSTREGQTIYLTRYQTSFTGAVILSR